MFLDVELKKKIISNYMGNTSIDNNFPYENDSLDNNQSFDSFRLKQNSFNVQNEDEIIKIFNIKDEINKDFFNLETIKPQEKNDLFDFKCIATNYNSCNNTKKKKFDVIYPEKKDNNNLLKKKRNRNDNERSKIKTTFFNIFIPKTINKIFISNGSKKEFWKFPHDLINNLSRKKNKELVNMTLIEFIEKEELYDKKNKNHMNKFNHNINVVSINTIYKDLKRLLSKTIRELFEEYIKEYDQLENSKKKKEDPTKAQNRKELAKNLINFISK